MKLLITGGAGFIGSHLIDRLLEKKHTVVCVDDLSLGRISNISHNLKNPAFKFVKLDINDRKKLNLIFKKNKFDCVFHMAANSDIQAGSRSREIDLTKTFLTTFNVLEAMSEYGVKQIVFASTSAVYGQGNNKFHEKTGPLFPISFYGSAKLASEGYITAFCENFGIKSWIIRFPNVIGSRATHGAVYDFIKRLKQNPKQLKVLGNGTQQKPYLHVSDLVSAILFAWEKSKDKVNCFNVAGVGATRVSEIAETVVKELNYSGTKIIYGKENRGWVGDVPRFSYDVKKINRLGWKARLSSGQAVKLAVSECVAKS